MEMINDLQAMGLALGARGDVALDDLEAATAALTLVHVQCDDLDLASLSGAQELQDRLDQAIADARWASAGF